MNKIKTNNGGQGKLKFILSAPQLDDHWQGYINEQYMAVTAHCLTGALSDTAFRNQQAMFMIM